MSLSLLFTARPPALTRRPMRLFARPPVEHVPWGQAGVRRGMRALANGGAGARLAMYQFGMAARQRPPIVRASERHRKQARSVFALVGGHNPPHRPFLRPARALSRAARPAFSSTPNAREFRAHATVQITPGLETGDGPRPPASPARNTRRRRLRARCARRPRRPVLPPIFFCLPRLISITSDRPDTPGSSV